MTGSKILCAVDLTDESPLVVNAARLEAERIDASLEFVFVQAQPALAAISPLVMMVMPTLCSERSTAEQGARLEGLRSSSRTGRPETTRVVPVEGSTGETLIRYSEEAEVDRIVVGHHPRTGLSRWLFGSVSERVVRDSRVPVLVVPLDHLPGHGLALPAAVAA